MQTLSVDQLVGQKLGNYRIERLLAQGRLKTVYLAQNRPGQSTDTLTLYHVPEHFSLKMRQRFLARFFQEADVVSSLRHPHILPVLEYGEYGGSPYVVTPYITNGSIADMIKRQGRCSHADVLAILEQVAAGLECAHMRGYTHGTLRPSNIVLDDKQTVLIAGFGFMHMLQMSGIEQSKHPYTHLLNIVGTFMTAPEYIAPEIVQGSASDTRSDIYALGTILFELLSGHPPFRGTSVLDVAMQHVNQSAPSLRSLTPDVPVALESVINQALEREPDRRFQHIGELVEAFALASKGATDKLYRIAEGQPISRRERNLEPLVIESGPLRPPIDTEKLNTFKDQAPARLTESLLSQGTKRLSDTEPDPQSVQSEQSSPRQARQKTAKKRRDGLQRRQIMIMLVISIIIVIAGITLFEVAHPLRPVDDDADILRQTRPVSAPSFDALKPPYLPASQTTTMAVIKDTTIGKISIPVNSAVNFTNPINGQPGILVHLPDGSFVAYSRTCTHDGALVNYDPGTHMLVCPMGTIFDPASDARVVRGPATTPLAEVSIHINIDGTITAF